jgi:hypothetical protein
MEKKPLEKIETNQLNIMLPEELFERVWSITLPLMII